MKEDEIGMEYEVWIVAFEIDHSQLERKPVLNDTLPSQFFFKSINHYLFIFSMYYFCKYCSYSCILHKQHVYFLPHRLIIEYIFPVSIRC